jgi:hypothetical protein
MLRSARRGADSPNLPIEGALQAIQPLFLSAEGLYIVGSKPGPATVLVSAQGIVHPLKRLCDRRVLQAHAERVSANGIRARLNAELAARTTGPVADPLVFFIDVMVPGVSGRDLGHEQLQKEEFTLHNAQIGEIFECPLDLDHVLRNAPTPDLPSPSLWVLGRAWLLTQASAVPPSVHILYDGRQLAMTGEYITVKTLREQWNAAISRHCEAAASDFLSTPNVTISERLRIAHRDLADSGVVARGDFLYLGANPVRVGHMIPPHYSHTLGQRVGKELALTAPLQFPPRIPANSDLVIYQRGARGCAAMPRQVCLGSVPAVDAAQGVAEAGVNLLAFLRLGAIRIAANGRFHENDGREE